MKLLRMAEINMEMVVFLGILPIGFALWALKQSHRFQRNTNKGMLVLGVEGTPLVLWCLNSVLAKSSP